MMPIQSFFQCTLSIRKLFVLLGPSPNNDRDYLPMMWVRATFARILILVQVMFSEAASSGGPTLQPKPQLSRALSNKKLNNKRDESTSSMVDFHALSSELVASSRSAVVVARKSQCNSWAAVFMRRSSNNKSDQSSELSWPLNIWHQIEKGVVHHYEGMGVHRSTYEVNCSNTDLETSVKSRMASLADNNQAISLMGKKQTSSDVGTKATCHVATVSDTICLIVIKSQERQKLSDDDITRYLDTATPLLVPGNVFGIDVVLGAKSLMSGAKELRRGVNTGLWSEDKQKQMKILNTLGLRKSKNSPIIAPLKSPYVKDLRRRRKKKATLNHGHLALFLGSDLSQIM